MKNVDYYCLNVSYPGHDHDYDRQVERAVRRSSDGGGYCFFDGRRDVDFFFRTKQAAKNAAERVRAMRPKKRGTRASIRFEPAEGN